MHFSLCDIYLEVDSLHEETIRLKLAYRFHTPVSI